VHSLYASLGPPESTSTSQTAYRSIESFLHTSCPYILQWVAPFPLKIAPSQFTYGAFGSHLIVPQAHSIVHIPYDISIGSAVLRAHDCDRQTDQQTTNNCAPVSRPNNRLRCGVITVTFCFLYSTCSNIIGANPSTTCSPPRQQLGGLGSAVSSRSGIRGDAPAIWRFTTRYRLTKAAPGVDFADVKFISVKFSWGSAPEKTSQPNFCGVRTA